MFAPHKTMTGPAQITRRIVRRRIPCALMRGGTSRGPFFLADDLPANREARDELLLQIMGAPEFRRVDGIGGMDPVTSKLAIVSRSERADADVDYLFGQADLSCTRIDYSANCGNMLAAVAPFAIERGILPAKHSETLVRVHNLNTGSLVHVVVQTPQGSVRYDGPLQIDGVPGSGAPISLQFMDAIGTKTGRLLPTGLFREEIQGVPASCLDVAVPLVILSAADFGLRGDESPDQLNGNVALLARLERIRVEAGRRMGLGDCSNLVIPKLCLVSPPKGNGQITSRYFTPKACHPSHAVTGALCLAVACRLPDTVAALVASGIQDTDRQRIVVEHPSGTIAADLEGSGAGASFVLSHAGFLRTANHLFDGHVFVFEGA